MERIARDGLRSTNRRRAETRRRDGGGGRGRGLGRRAARIARNREATNGAADRDASDDEVMPTPKRRGPPTDGDAALAAALDADLAAKKPLPDFRSDGPRVGETIRRKVERPTGPAWAEGKIIGYLGPDESDFVDANGAKAALYPGPLREWFTGVGGRRGGPGGVGDQRLVRRRSPLDEFGRPAN